MAAIDFVDASMTVRCTGMTTALIKVALEQDVPIVAVNHGHAKSIAGMSKDVKIRILSQNPRGTHGRYVFDHFTVEQIVLNYERQILNLKKELTRKNNFLEKLKDWVYDLEECD